MTGAVTLAVDTRSPPGGADLRAVVEEFGELLAVLGVELTHSVHEADRDCVAVGNAFQQLAAANARIEATSRGAPQPELLEENCASITASLGDAVIALQCQDRLAQRIGHIRASLDHLQRLLRDGINRSCEEWLSLLRHVESAHRAEQARLLAAQVTPNGSAELF